MIEECSRLLKTKNKETWFNELRRIAIRLDFKEVLFGLKRTPHSRLQSAEVITNFKDLWRKRYEANDYVLVDPMVSNSLRTVIATIWTPTVYVTAEQKTFHEEACLHGYCSGITLPLHGPRGEAGTLSFNLGETQQRPDSLTHIKHQCAALALVRDLALSQFLTFTQESDGEEQLPAEALKLTPRTLEILKWSACGKTSWEISIICGCSEANINFHLGEARRALSVSSRKAAIIKAYTLGLIAL